MKSYIKPTIALAITGNDSGSYSSCIVKADMDLLESILGGSYDDFSKAFATTEPCSPQIPIEIYCKFTSAQLGAAQAFIS